VMEKKLGMQLLGHDIFMNVVGGVRVDEPAVDMGVIAAVASSFLDRPVAQGAVVFGEVGLTGEVRAVSRAEIRVAEIAKMGFTRCLVPDTNLKRMSRINDCELLGIKSISEAMEILF